MGYITKAFLQTCKVVTSLLTLMVFVRIKILNLDKVKVQITFADYFNIDPIIQQTIIRKFLKLLLVKFTSFIFRVCSILYAA